MMNPARCGNHPSIYIIGEVPLRRGARSTRVVYEDAQNWLNSLFMNFFEISSNCASVCWFWLRSDSLRAWSYGVALRTSKLSLWSQDKPHGGKGKPVRQLFFFGEKRYFSWRISLKPGISRFRNQGLNVLRQMKPQYRSAIPDGYLTDFPVKYWRRSCLCRN